MVENYIDDDRIKQKKQKSTSKSSPIHKNLGIKIKLIICTWTNVNQVNKQNQKWNHFPETKIKITVIKS